MEGIVPMNFNIDAAPPKVEKKSGNATKPATNAPKGPPAKVLSSDDVTAFGTFEECYMAKIHGKKPISSDPTVKQAEMDYTGKDTIDTLRNYEREYDCSGVCDVPLFYLTKDLSEGPPTEDCVDSILKSFTDSYIIAVISFTLFLMFFCGMLATCPNCFGRRKEKSKKGKHHELAEESNTSR